MDSDITYGIVFNVTGDFLCIKEMRELSCYGYTLISTKDIKGIYQHRFDSKIREVIIGEKLNSLSEDILFLKTIGNWKLFGKEMFNRGLYASYETKDDEIHIGRIISVNDEGLNLICVKEDFSHEKKPYFLNYNQILDVVLKSNYVDIYQKYSF